MTDRERSVDSLAQLFAYYLEHPEAMPKSYTEFAQRNPPYRIVCDYIAGMTDHYLLRGMRICWGRDQRGRRTESKVT